MKVRGGFAAIVSLMCLMILVIVGGRSGQTDNTAELAVSEDLVVGTDDGHSHAEGEEHSHADGEDHTHADGAAHDHADGAAHAHDSSDPTHAHDENDPTHAHPEGTQEDPGHCHENCDPSTPPDPNHCHENCDPSTPTHPHPVDPTPTVYTQTQLDLLAATQAWISPRYDNVQAAIDAGYRSINDAGTGYEHFVNNEYLNSSQILTPNTIESLVYKVSGSSRTLVSGMYILPLGQTLNNTPPAFTTPQTPWHVHSNLCWKLNPIRVVGTTSTGQAGCPPDSVYFVTPPMLHVWLEEQPCGWFSDLEQANGDCSAHPH